jgi:Tfp pilus assembly protein FimV
LTNIQTTRFSNVQLAGALAVVMFSASSSYAASVNLQGLQSSFTYTPFAGESLDRIMAKTMPNTDLNKEVVAEAFRALNPHRFTQDQGAVTKSNVALKVPNQNQLSGLIESQANPKRTLNLLHGTTTATPKINPKTENWIRLPAKMAVLTQKMESWVRYPSPANGESSASADSKNWVRYLSGHVNTLRGGDIATSTTADWVRFPSATSHNLATSSASPIDQSEWVRYVAKN